ncbi:penicillin-binding protein activator LpoB [Marinobacterium weihaiense]|uniref:Penicillin-binding protein activator LpoB n=1 Tax=Marinobacterium weihaiense TaxID=2851016 RepID=A0ABS6MFB2_9GAMM|nr:penicillin-binding protein activator LpoB [Marinobacterium weihaiense]MBV0934412.1 penicillin-binding protein activator LpoB [Marinobacterium weihaiense]
MSTRNTLIKVLAVSTAFGLATGCTPKTQLLTPGAVDQPVTMGLSGSDFAQAASDAVQSMLTSGAVDRSDGKKNIMVVSTVLNDTMQRIDTDQLVKKIRVDLLRSGKVLTTTAIGLNGAEDRMTQAYGELSQSRKVDRSTLVRQRLAAPNMSLSGKIIQRNNRVDGNQQLVEYYFQLTLTDLANGLAIWEGETPIRKLGSAKGTSW